MSDYRVDGDHAQVKLSGGRIVEATIKAVLEATEGVRLQVSFGSETALIYPWQIDHRTHTSREGRTPDTTVARPVANLRSVRWQPHCRSLYQTPMAA
jgi:hypothetical protein